MDERFLELFCIENDFAKYRNLFKYFVSHITVIPRNDTFLYHRTNQISLSLVSEADLGEATGFTPPSLKFLQSLAFFQSLMKLLKNKK